MKVFFRIFSYLAIFVLGFAISQFYEHGIKNPKFAPPERPPNVPEEAYWSGGIDGGFWFLCNEKETGKIFCKLYNDFTGELEIQGTYKFEIGGDFPPGLYYASPDVILVGDGRLVRIED